MSKIKITQKEKVIEGKLYESKVTPFGTSAHIPFSKQHTGKIVNVIVPDGSKYIWLITKEEQSLLFEYAIETILEKGGELEHYRLELLKDLEHDSFALDSLIKILEFVPDKKLVAKIKSLYNIK